MEAFLLIVTFASLSVAVVTSAAAWKSAREHRERAAARVNVLKALAFEGEPPGMFGAAVEQAAPKRRWAALAAVGVVMASVAGTAFALHEPPSAAHPPAKTTIDLLTLKQTTDGRTGKLVVTGEVRNHDDGEPLKGVAAFVDLFDRDGRLVAGDKASLDVSVLEPGGAASFTVAVPKTAGVARYRVRFRLSNGSLVPHIDRRVPSAAGTDERTNHEHAD